MQTAVEELKRGVETWLNEAGLNSAGNSILVAVSGGIDSMVLLHILTSLGKAHAIAHCNFQLRGAESDSDEQLVKDFAVKLGIPFFVNKFDTAEYAQNRGISIQLAARELRYNWFTRLSEENGFSHTAVAHNQDDSVETFFINLFRGSGVRGLDGIPTRNGRFIRPLLFAERAQIIEYAEQFSIPWREDSSNLKDAYLRNRIRHRVIPELKSASGNAMPGISRTMELMNSTGILMDAFLETWKMQYCHNTGSELQIPLKALLDFPQPRELLSEILVGYGFPGVMSSKILDAADSSESKKFYGSTHRLVTTRNQLIINKLATSGDTPSWYIGEGTEQIDQPVSLNLKVIIPGIDFKPDPDSKKAYLDLDALQFPLEIRRWRAGDRFMPLGMNQFKKLSDFFIDEAYTLPQKEQCWLILSGGEIIWIMGKRIDQRFRIKTDTKRILCLSL
ncbi:MAG: tRNA lysidine(34) synthetase TilS [Bacteroidales bacterium]